MTPPRAPARALGAILVVLFLAACASHPTRPVTTGSGSLARRASPAPSLSPSGQPRTAAAAGSAAAAYFDLYAAGQWKLTYKLMTPTARRVIARADWLGVHHRCHQMPSLQSYQVTHVQLDGRAALVTVTVNAHTSRTQRFDYVGERWLFAPKGLRAYREHDLAEELAAARADEFCR